METNEQILSDCVFEMEEEFYEEIATIICCEVEDFKNINWDVVEEAVQDAKNVTRYIEEAEWEKAHEIILETLIKSDRLCY